MLKQKAAHTYVKNHTYILIHSPNRAHTQVLRTPAKNNDHDSKDLFH